MMRAWGFEGVAYGYEASAVVPGLFQAGIRFWGAPPKIGSRVAAPFHFCICPPAQVTGWLVSMIVFSVEVVWLRWNS